MKLVFLPLLCAFALTLSCRAALLDSTATAKATIALKIVGSPPAPSSSSSRLITNNAGWIRLTLTSEAKTEYYTKPASNPTFSLTVALGKTYALTAEAGTTTGTVETVLYSGSTTFTAVDGTAISLNLLPKETTPWPEINADSYTIAPGAIYGQTSTTYRVRMGTAERWYINGATGYGTDLQIYVQNEDGSAVTPTEYTANRYIVQKSALSSSATSFLVTLYDASTNTSSSIAPSMASGRANSGYLIFYDTIASLPVNSLPSGITYLGGKFYVALNNSTSIYSINADGSGGTSYSGFQNPWGITDDGTDLYVALQYGGPNGQAVKSDITGTLAWTSAVTRASGIAILGSNVYVTDNSENTVYRVPLSGGTAALVAGSGSAASVDGTGTGASIYSPAGICSDGTNLYVVETAMGAYRIRKIDPTGYVVTTFAGNGSQTITDGIGTAAGFSNINHIASDGTYLYLTDKNTIRRVTIADAKVETIFAFAPGITLDGLVKVGDALYITDSDLNLVYKVY